MFALTADDALWTYADGERTVQRNLGLTKRSLHEVAFSPDGRNGVIHPYVWDELGSSQAVGAPVLVTTACATVGAGYRPSHDYLYDLGIATGDEIVIDCHRRASHQVVRSVDLGSLKPLGPGFRAGVVCCYPISDDAAVGADLPVTASDRAASTCPSTRTCSESSRSARTTRPGWPSWTSSTCRTTTA